MDRDELRELFSEAGFGLSGAQFEAIYDRAARQDPYGLVSVESFRKIYNAIHMR